MAEGRKIYTEAFELFWQSSPERYNEAKNAYIRADKEGAFREWQKLTVEQMILALKAVQKEKASKYTPDMRKWLKYKRWEDEVMQQPPKKPLPTEIQAMVDKLAAGMKKVPLGGMNNKELNKRRNQLLNELESHAGKSEGKI